jgi:hypothetical protein
VSQVSTGEPRRGRRDNGLVAADYAAAGDVDPRVGEHLLDVLALEGIAAYLRPSSDLHPITRTATLPDRPTDRLFVDRLHLATARGYLVQLAADAEAAAQDEERAPGDEDGADNDLDQQWDEIISGYHEQARPDRPWPAAEDLPDQRPEPPPGSPGAGSARSRHATRDDEVEGRAWRDAARTDGPWGDRSRDERYRDERYRDERYRDELSRGERSPAARDAWRGSAEDGSLLDGLDTFGAGLADDTEDGFTPPPPPPLPRPALPTVLAAAGVIGGLVVFLRPSLLPVDGNLAMFLGVAALMAGFVTLVWRLRPGDDDDIDPDQGARV